jgi:hypothetical protein
MTAPDVVEGIMSGLWWAIALRALAAILLGIIAIFMPGPTLAAIVIVFGIYAIIDGILAIVAAVRGFRRKERWWPMLLEGLVGIAAGAIAIFWPGIGALALTYLVAAWALVTGAFEIAAAIRLRKVIYRRMAPADCRSPVDRARRARSSVSGHGCTATGLVARRVRVCVRGRVAGPGPTAEDLDARQRLRLRQSKATPDDPVRHSCCRSGASRSDRVFRPRSRT